MIKMVLLMIQKKLHKPGQLLYTCECVMKQCENLASSAKITHVSRDKKK